MEIFIDENLDNNDIEPFVKPPTFGGRISYTVFLTDISILGLGFFDEISQISIIFF